MRDDNKGEEVREDSTNKDVKGDLREDNLINGLYACVLEESHERY